MAALVAVTEQAGEFRDVLELSDRCEPTARRPRPGGTVTVLPAPLLGRLSVPPQTARPDALF